MRYSVQEGTIMVFTKEVFEKTLKANGMKLTNQRLLVYQVLSSCPGKHLTAEEIYECVKADYPDIGLATVYRTIQLLLELNLIDWVNFDDGFIRYEIGSDLSNDQKHHHHHLICQKCQKVLSFEDDLLDELEKNIYQKTGFSVVNHKVKLYGICKECGGKLN